MLDTLRYVLELAASQCLPEGGLADAGLLDYAVGAVILFGVSYSCFVFARALRGSDPADIQAIKHQVLED